MARATTLTKLPLDRWAQIIGLNPIHFNRITISLSPDRACNSGEDFWLQWPYMDASKVSIEDLASAIAEAEGMIESVIGYKLLPDWIVDERRNTERPAIRELFSFGINARWLAKSVKARWGYVQSGGQRAKSVISAGAAIVRSDADGDGYQETATVTVASAVDTDEVHVYFPGESGADEWEVKPVQVIASGANLVITFKIWQVPDPDLWERLSTDPAAIDGDNIANFLTTVDVYRVYNNPQTQVQFLWEPDPLLGTCGCGSETCAVCTFGTQYGCLHVRDTRLGNVAYSPADWNSSSSDFSASEWSLCRDPDRMRLWYQAGWRWETTDARKRPNVDVDPYWEKAIAYLAITLLNREVCACNNTEHFIDYWRTDLARNGNQVSYQNTAQVLNNPFGTMRGAVYAWQRCQAEERIIQR
jgi:hypothetical protein